MENMLPPIGVFWDIENCQVPKNRSAIAIVEKIKEMFFENYLETEFMCVCDVNKENPQIIQELNYAQVNVIHVAAIHKNAADNKLRQCIRRFADIHSHPAKIILISSDVNFIGEVNDLRHRKKLEVTVIYNNKASDSLLSVASSHFNFQDIIRDLPNTNPVNNQPNEFSDVIVTNLPELDGISTEKIKFRLKFLTENTGGKVESVGSGEALIKFPNHDTAARAQKRINGEDVFGKCISASVVRRSKSPFVGNRCKSPYSSKMRKSPQVNNLGRKSPMYAMSHASMVKRRNNSFSTSPQTGFSFNFQDDFKKQFMLQDIGKKYSSDSEKKGSNDVARKKFISASQTPDKASTNSNKKKGIKIRYSPKNMRLSPVKNISVIASASVSNQRNSGYISSSNCESSDVSSKENEVNQNGIYRKSETQKDIGTKVKNKKLNKRKRSNSTPVAVRNTDQKSITKNSEAHLHKNDKRMYEMELKVKNVPKNTPWEIIKVNLIKLFESVTKIREVKVEMELGNLVATLFIKDYLIAIDNIMSFKGAYFMDNKIFITLKFSNEELFTILTELLKNNRVMSWLSLSEHFYKRYHMNLRLEDISNLDFLQIHGNYLGLESINIELISNVHIPFSSGYSWISPLIVMTKDRLQTEVDGVMARTDRTYIRAISMYIKEAYKDCITFDPNQNGAVRLEQLLNSLTNVVICKEEIKYGNSNLLKLKLSNGQVNRKITKISKKLGKLKEELVQVLEGKPHCRIKIFKELEAEYKEKFSRDLDLDVINYNIFGVENVVQALDDVFMLLGVGKKQELAFTFSYQMQRFRLVVNEITSEFGSVHYSDFCSLYFLQHGKDFNIADFGVSFIKDMLSFFGDNFYITIKKDDYLFINKSNHPQTSIYSNIIPCTLNNVSGTNNDKDSEHNCDNILPKSDLVSKIEYRKNDVSNQNNVSSSISPNSSPSDLLGDVLHSFKNVKMQEFSEENNLLNIDSSNVTFERLSSERGLTTNVISKPRKSKIAAKFPNFDGDL